ncbi:Zeta toxin [Rosistilla ulvae]|uniref:Zeta toxin n=1 Tax=Rosistilla ulvae TaxID=1930277 RepID=A0A517M5H3_9BACT|nr:zeta toxin family protein [Rosistilla ulvae]QDS90121.1 Zeta toxin [Rosistilla ulvae]
MSGDSPNDRPTIIALAGSNGAGKSTFYETHLASLSWPFVNADLLAKELSLDPYPAAELAKQQREELFEQKASFIFETVFSDPVGEKVGFLEEAAKSGYHVILSFVAIRDPEMSIQRVGMRVSQGGHSVPIEKLRSRHARTLENLKLAIRCLPQVRIFDNSDLSKPYEHVATFVNGEPQTGFGMLSAWLIKRLASEFYPGA